MPYADTNNLRLIVDDLTLAHWTDDTDDGETGVDEAKVTAALSYASSFIDSYLSAIYDTVPLTSVPDSIKYAAATLAAHTLASRRPPIPPEIKESYARILDWLTQLRDGTLSLGDSADDMSDYDVAYGATEKDDTYFEDTPFQ